MNDKIKIIPLGGLDESGRNCTVVEINDDIFVVDAGSSLPDKTIPGVDFLLPNFSYLEQNKNRVKGYIITHGHDESIGALQFLYNDAPAPIFCTNSTRIIIEAEARRFKLKVNFDFKIINPSDRLYIAGHYIQLFQTVHNAAYSFGVCFETSLGNIIYSGDFIVDFTTQQKAYYFDLKTLEEIASKPTLLLMCESEAANKPGYCSPQYDTYNRLYKIFKDTKKRIFITCFWQNFYRINEICRLAKDTHKKIYFYNDYTSDVMKELLQADDSIQLNPMDIIQKEDLLRVRAQDEVILLLGRGEKLYLELQKIINKTNDDKRIVLGADDLFINVAIPTPTLETLAISSMDSLYRNECQVIWVKPKEISSMHARQDDIKFLLSLLKPKYYLPIRGNYVSLISNARLALSMNIGLNFNNILIIDNGMDIAFDENGKAKIGSYETNKIDVAPVLVDGVGVCKIAADLIADRKKLGTDGTILVAAQVSPKERKIIAGPDCQMRGFVYSKDAEPLLKTISQIFNEELRIALLSDVSSYDQTIKIIQDRIIRYIKRETGKEPFVIPIILTDKD